MKTKKITQKNRLLATSTVTAMILSPLSAANAGFLDSLNSIRSVVSDIGYTANSVSYTTNSAKEMTNNLGLTGTTSTAQDNQTLKSGDMLVSKLASLKLYADSRKAQLSKTLSQEDQMVYLGEEANGMLYVSTDKGDGWVQKPLVGLR